MPSYQDTVLDALTAQYTVDTDGNMHLPECVCVYSDPTQEIVTLVDHACYSHITHELVRTLCGITPVPYPGANRPTQMQGFDGLDAKQRELITHHWEQVVRSYLTSKTIAGAQRESLREVLRTLTAEGLVTVNIEAFKAMSITMVERTITLLRIDLKAEVPVDDD